MIQKLLIANRGEIAVRIIRSARELGIKTVLAASEADASSVAARMADEVVIIGPAEATKSYLAINRVVETAQSSQCDAVHPGYGFLSERPEFADACASAGLIFIGPPASAMRALGAKIDAKKLATRLGILLVPGYFESNSTDETLISQANEIGYPVMLKASAGGGGRGMRAVFNPSSITTELRLAREESQKAFGDSEMMIEKLIERPRHVEVQILADNFGNAVVLFERECSLQRRHQKLLEEAPSPLEWFGEKMWPAMRESALLLAREAGYRGAGTVEFIVDAASKAFYFLEVNARLQVEHPVTEAITGLDLVAWQLRIASGQHLSLPRNLSEGHREAVHGHAIEVRITAEDPGNEFLPSVGKILGWAEPSGPGVRVDSGFATGDTVTPYYDSLLAKLIVHGEDRAAALSKLRNALLDFHILGVKTNISYLLSLINLPAVQADSVDTGFLARELREWTSRSTFPDGLDSVIASSSTSSVGLNQLRASEPSAWEIADGFRNAR